MDDPAMLSAYDEYYGRVSRAQVARIAAISGLRPASVLDVGSGPGPVSLAFAELGARTFSLVDSSERALEKARLSLARFADSPGAPLSVSTAVADIESLEAIPDGGFDLVAFGHCLNEVGRGDDRVGRRLAIARRAARAVAPGGAALVMDPATLAASRDSIALRDALLAEGWTVRAPCTFPGPCPALAAGPTQTCHDEAPWDVPPEVGRLASEAGLDRDLIKMSWFILSPPPRRAEALPGEAEPRPSGGAYRVVSMPMLNKGGRVRYLLCGPGGRFPFSARRDDEAARAGGFFSLGRYELISVDEPEPREGGWGFGARTAIRRLGSLAHAGRDGIGCSDVR
ncbi:MAG: small ribosomal subunit Rsm22 family protein [Spirochaetes bacterium]|nr:small ribosomal subunit Rsm22 family protein [Spirochaetota bacterium]